jgi:hypothetical protein
VPWQVLWLSVIRPTQWFAPRYPVGSCTLKNDNITDSN